MFPLVLAHPGSHGQRVVNVVVLHIMSHMMSMINNQHINATCYITHTTGAFNILGGYSTKESGFGYVVNPNLVSVK